MNRRSDVCVCFEVDAEVGAMLNALADHYQLGSRANLIRAAIALMDIARLNEQPDKTVVVRTRTGDMLRVNARSLLPLKQRGRKREPYKEKTR